MIDKSFLTGVRAVREAGLVGPGTLFFVLAEEPFEEDSEDGASFVSLQWTVPGGEVMTTSLTWRRGLGGRAEALETVGGMVALAAEDLLSYRSRHGAWPRALLYWGRDDRSSWSPSLDAPGLVPCTREEWLSRPPEGP